MATVSENAYRLIRSQLGDSAETERFYQHGLAYFGSDRLFAQWLTNANAYTMGQAPIAALGSDNGLEYLRSLMERTQDDGYYE